VLVPADEAQRRDVAWDGRLKAVQQALDLTVVEILPGLHGVAHRFVSCGSDGGGCTSSTLQTVA